MRNNPITGAAYFFRGLGLLNRRGVKRYVAIPLLINTLLFSLLIYFGASQFEHFLESLLPSWLEWLRWLLWPLFAVAVLLTVFFCFSLVANLIAAPFNGFLAEAVEQQVTGTRPETGSGYRELIAEIVRSIASELRKLAYILVRAIPLLILFVIPGINVIAPFLWLLFSAWMLAVEYADYPMANHGLVFAEQRRLLRSRRLTSLGFGAMVSVAMAIPILNFLVMPTAVAGATVMWVEQFPDHRSVTA